VQAVEKAYQLDPQDPQVRWAFGLIMLRNQIKMAEAIGAWEALLRDDPEYAQRLGLKDRIEQIKKFMAPGGGHPPMDSATKTAPKKQP
jgi:cytochrome c-type biogenesis protein CcmH/NrfG